MTSYSCFVHVEGQDNNNIPDMNQSVDQVDPPHAIQNLPIQLFNDNEGLFEHERLDQSRPLQKDTKMAFYDTTTGRWKKVTITSNPISRKGWKDWFNFIDELGIEGGGFFPRNERWSIIDDHVNNIPVFNPIPQIDGTYLPESATPDTSPEKSNQDHVTDSTGARSKIRFDAIQFLSSSSDNDEEPPDSPGFNTAFDWDSYGTELECDLPVLPTHKPPVDLNQVANLDHVLPLTSTPLPVHQRQTSDKETYSASRSPPTEKVDMENHTQEIQSRENRSGCCTSQ